MNREILKVFFIILIIINLVFILFFITTNPVYAEGVVADDDPVLSGETTTEPDDNPNTDTSSDDSNTTTTPTTTPSPSSISGSIWEDKGNYGVYDVGEILISGITVNLYNVTANNCYFTTSTTTYNGSYTFENVSAGTYYIEFTYDNEQYNGLDYMSAITDISSLSNLDGKSYAADSPEKRLELMNTFLNINSSTDFSSDTSMTARTPDFVVEASTTYTVNFSIKERPKSEVCIEKKVTNLTITLSDGNTLIDWSPNQKVKHLIVYPESLPESLTAIMDDEIMHGATIQIKYKITITNNSESDTLSNYFTDNFIKAAFASGNYANFFNSLADCFDSTTINLTDSIPTKYYIYDYIDNNSIFDDNNSTGWTLVESTLPINENTSSTIQTILEYSSGYLYPGDTVTFELSTSKLMTIDDTDDLHTYNNYVELVQYSSVLGRRIYDITPGNLDVTDEDRVKNLESDEAEAETVTCIPPFGKDLSYYTTIVGIVVLAIEIVVLGILKYKIKHIRNKYIME